MLAAKPETTAALELLRLALAMISDRESAIPDDLRRYFERVVGEAKALRDSGGIAGKAPLPESIELAYRITTRADLDECLEGVSDINSVSPDLAAKLLTSMESDAVYFDQFAPSS
jgi:hypothetical protein